MYHPLYHLVRRVGNDSVICVTEVTDAVASFGGQFWAEPKSVVYLWAETGQF